MTRIADKRARQFWDPHHLVATALDEFAKQNPDQPQPQCCKQKGFDWDEAILFSPRSRWEDMPPALFWNGPVVRVMSDLETTFKRTSTSLTGRLTGQVEFRRLCLSSWRVLSAITAESSLDYL